MMARRWITATTIGLIGITQAMAQDRTPETRESNVDPVEGAPVIHSVSYIESSTGLESPRWDGGQSELELADLNLDGHLDIVTVGDHGSPYVNTDMHGITVWFGNGRGAWTASQNGSFGYGGIAVGDVNNDGSPDVGYGVHHNYSGNDFGDQLMEVALGDGTGRNWTPWDDGLGLHGQSWGMFGSEFADIDCDGLLDFGCVSFGCCNGFHVYRNNGDGTWMWSFASTGGNSTMEITSGDVNNDGYPDFCTSIENSTVWINDGAGGFVPGDAGLPPAGSIGRRGAFLGDVNRDGFDDLSFINDQGGIEVWLRDESSQMWIDGTSNLPPTGSAQTSRLVDMNGDDWVDVVAFGDGRLAVFENDHHGHWTLAATFTVPSPGDYAAMRIDDADHNGYPDIAIVASKGSIFNQRNYLHFFRETSRPAFSHIQLVAPALHRTIRGGSASFITWRSAVHTDQIDEARVKLEISTAGPGGPWQILATDLPNNGSHQFKVADGISSNDCFVRATLMIGDATFRDMKGPFTIIAE